LQLTGSGMLAGHQHSRALDGGPVQILDYQHQDPSADMLAVI
jgi:hypothetical protein